MIETIPNPLTDKTVQRDIQDKVKELLTYKGGDRNAAELIKDLVTKAAEWGMSTGFRMGWRVYEVTKGGRR